MKKAHSKDKYGNFFLCLLAVCFIFFNVSCGLDVLSVVLDDPVTDVTSLPNITSSYENLHFTFETKQLDNANDFGYGYVYYKIYNRSTSAESEANNLIKIATDENRKSASASSMRDYGFKELKLLPSSGKATPLRFENESQNIRIRLTTYDASTSFRSIIAVDDVSMGTPLRCIDGTFDFKTAASTGEGTVFSDAAPQKGDEDAKNLSDTPPAPGVFYVSLFYVFMMYDDTYTPIYSPVHYLGTVRINADERN